MRRYCALERPTARRVSFWVMAALVSATVGGAREASAGASDWSKAQKSSARLLSAGGLSGGNYVGGVEIKLDPGSLTYWRHPGDAGVPPVFSFDGSQNVASIRVLYPAPKRFEEAGSEVFGYKNEVIFPLEIVPADRSRPVDLVLDLQYAACDRICIPAQGNARLRFIPGASADREASRIAASVERAPKSGAGPGAPSLKADRRPDANAKAIWTALISPPDPTADLFAEGPEGWYFDTKRSASGFTVSLAQKPADGASEADVTFTYATPAGAWEYQRRLDAGRPTP